MATKEFEILMNYLGWGDPNAVLWTVGVEEAGMWCSDEKREDLSQIRKRIREFNSPIIPMEEVEEEPKFPIAHPIAKIACGISKSCKNWKEEWRKYRKSKLWRKGSKICNINLYPLGKKSLKSSFPNCYKEIFGIDWKDYDIAVKEQRLKKIFNFFREKQPQAVICYGKSHWNDFIEVFQLQNKKAEEHSDKLTILYPEEKIILTRHFSNGFRNDICQFIIEKLKEWKVNLP